MVGLIEIAVIALFGTRADAIAAEPNRACFEDWVGWIDKRIGGVRGAAQVGAVIVIHRVTVVTGLYSNGKHSITAVRA